MDHRTKGFTLIELLVAIGIFLVLITLAVPAFTRSAQITKADTEIGDLQRWLELRPPGGDRQGRDHPDSPDGGR
jgi:prepilin-type N-terminal cleavage/methylation domain-containing protein